MAETSGVTYIKMTSPQGDADYGKMPKGKVYAMPADKAARFIGAGIAEETDEAALKAQSEKRRDTVKTNLTRAGEFNELNQEGAAHWDSATHRDVLTAPEEGLRAAVEAGVPLVNTNYLEDEDGVPLPQDASVDDILDARQRLSFGIEPEHTAHAKSSVMGGGSHTQTEAARTEEFSTLGGIQPLNAPAHKLSAAQLGNVSDDDSDDADPVARPARGRPKARIKTLEEKEPGE